MSKLRAIGRSIHNPAVAHAFLAAMTVLGAWTVLEGLVAQAREAGRQLAAVQAQAQATVRRARAAAEAAAQAQVYGAGIYPDQGEVPDAEPPPAETGPVDPISHEGGPR